MSRQSVSNAINAPRLVRAETRARVRAAIDALGYRASQAGRQRRTGRSRLVAARIEPPTDGINGSAPATRGWTSTAGHRRIGFLGWSAGPGTGDDRRTGWAQTLLAAGVDPAGLETSTRAG